VLYSIVRPSKGGGNLDVPVVGDFVIIGVLAEKGETSFINANALKKDIKDEDSEKKKKWDHVKGAEEEKEDDEEEEPDETFRPQSKSQKKRRFIRFSLVDLSTPTSSATGSGTLTLLLFESDSSDLVTEDGGKKRGNYRGGSGGAYEKWWKESEGAVVAVLNPKVMKQASQSLSPVDVFFGCGLTVVSHSDARETNGYHARFSRFHHLDWSIEGLS
jgi:minichromosome maintenance protein 10